MQRRFFLHAAPTLAACAWTVGAGVRQAHAQGLASAAFPVRPIRLVIAFPAGGPTDGLVRILAANASAILGQPVWVDNRPGAGGGLPLKELLAAPADGYTLAQLPVGVARALPAAPASQGGPGEDMVVVIQVTGYTLGLSVAPDSPLIGGNGFADWARASLGRLLYGPDSAQPDPAPTQPSLGLGLIHSEPLGIGAPRGTPAAVVRRLHEAFGQAMAQPNFRQALRSAGAA